MATLEQLLAEVGLAEESQEKTASASAPSTNEVNQVLEGLGLAGMSDEGVTKTASQERNHMNLLDVYEGVFGEEVTETEGQEKVAYASGEEYVNEGSTSMGELVGIYFNVLHDSCMEKIAGDLEAEAGAGHNPFAHSPESGELSKIVGKEGNPHQPMNHEVGSGKPLVTNPGNHTPYSLKAQAQVKSILKRRMKADAGDVGGYHE